jgi:hypothetical protein
MTTNQPAIRSFLRLRQIAPRIAVRTRRIGFAGKELEANARDTLKVNASGELSSRFA